MNHIQTALAAGTMKPERKRALDFARFMPARFFMALILASGPMSAQEKPEQVSSERARANFGRPVVLAPDDVRAFPDAPAGFNKPATNGLAGRTEVFEYDSTVTGTRRKAVVYL